MLKRSLFILALMGAMPQMAMAFRAPNNNVVNPVSDSVFEVVGRVGTSAADFWCGAGDYARRVIGVGPGQRIYVVRELGPSETSNRRSAVQFSLTSPEGADTRSRLILSVKHKGDNIGAAMAQNYCLNHKVRGI